MHSSIARALVVSERSETRIVGGSADTDAKAVTVVPQGRLPSQLVTMTTPLASELIASRKSAAEIASSARGRVLVASRVMAFSSPPR